MRILKETVQNRSPLIASLFRGVLIFPFLYFVLDMTVANGYYVGSIGVVTQEDREVRLPRTGIKTDEDHRRLLEEFTAYLRENLKPGETLFVLPLNPIWYYLTETKNPTYYEWILPGMMRSPEMEEEVIRDLRSANVRFVVYADIAIDNREERRFPNYAPRIAAYISAHYRPVRSHDALFYILERIPESG
jgi:hypothetical protein